MRPLERSLEKLDEVRKKKLTEMIAGSEGGLVPATASGLDDSNFIFLLFATFGCYFVFLMNSWMLALPNFFFVVIRQLQHQDQVGASHLQRLVKLFWLEVHFLIDLMV